MYWDGTAKGEEEGEAVDIQVLNQNEEREGEETRTGQVINEGTEDRPKEE